MEPYGANVATANVATALPRFIAPSLVGLLAVMNVALLATVIVLALR